MDLILPGRNAPCGENKRVHGPGVEKRHQAPGNYKAGMAGAQGTSAGVEQEKAQRTGGD